MIISILAVLLSANISFGVNYFAAGKYYYKTKNYTKAAVQFKLAIANNPDNVNYRYYYAQTLVYLSKLDDAQREYEKIIELAPISDAAKLATIGIINIQKYYYNDSVDEEDSDDDIGENYIDNAQEKGKIVRWNLAKMPLRVCITSEPTVKIPIYYNNTVKNAFDIWINALDGEMAYEIVTDPKKADINVQFVSSIDTSAGKKEMTSYISGMTYHHITGSILRQVEIKFLALRPDNRYFTQSELYSTAVHEVGHSLGIVGHSFDKGDIMFPVAKKSAGKTTLTTRDINTLMLLYRLDPDISNFDSEMMAQKRLDKNSDLLGDTEDRLDNELKEAQDYVKNVPDHPISWTALGGAYNNKKMYSNAVDSYKKALTFDSSYPQAREGLANTYKEMGDAGRAISEYQNLVKSNPTNVNYACDLADLYKNSYRYQDSRNVILNLIKSNPQAGNNGNVTRLLNQLNR